MFAFRFGFKDGSALKTLCTGEEDPFIIVYAYSYFEAITKIGELDIPNLNEEDLVFSCCYEEPFIEDEQTETEKP